MYVIKDWYQINAVMGRILVLHEINIKVYWSQRVNWRHSFDLKVVMSWGLTHDPPGEIWADWESPAGVQNGSAVPEIQNSFTIIWGALLCFLLKIQENFCTFLIIERQE